MAFANTSCPQLSNWSTEQTSVSEGQHASDDANKNNCESSSMQWFDHITDDNSNNFGKQRYRLPMKLLRCCSSIPTCLRGLLLGVVIGGVALCVIIPLWLTSNNKTTSTFMKISTESSKTISTAAAVALIVPTGSTITTITTASTTASTVSASNTAASSSSTTILSSASTTIITTLPSTVASSSSTTVISSSSSTITSTSCSRPTSPILSYKEESTTYTLMRYNYSAASSGIGVLEFGFTSDRNDEWHLDDVSLRDLHASNSEMLINGDFENGTLAGWQLSCTNTCDQSGMASNITNKTCHTGSYCYKDACEDKYDFLRQTFTKTIGHIYALSFWLRSDGEL